MPSSEEWSGLKIPDNFNLYSPHDPVVNVAFGKRNLYIPQAIGLGGTSKIYGMLNARPHPDTLQSWPKGWQYNDLFPYFKKVEDHFCYYDSFEVTNITKKDCELYHGKSGPLQVNNVERNGFHRVSNAFTDICRDKSQIWGGFVSDYNGNPENAAGCVLPEQFKDRTNRKSRDSEVSRANSKTGYLKDDVLDRPNLSILVGSTVTRIVFDDTKTATGVEYYDSIGRTTKVIKASKEVILSAGAFNTPHLLQVSGVGDPVHLKKINVSIVAENDQVGKNLWDHVHVPYVFELNHCDERFNQVNGPFSWFLQFNSGVRKSQSSKIRDIQVALVDSSDGVSYKYKLGNLYKESLKNCSIPGTTTVSTFQIVLNYNNFRFGVVQALTKSIFDKPFIDLGLSDFSDEDKNAFKVTIEALRNHTIYASTPFSKLIKQELLPGNSNLEEFMKENIDSTFHPACSCRLGYCTDEHLNVRGTKSLKVCDASSFGSQVDGNPTATIYAMAELFSERLIKQYTNNKDAIKWRSYESVLILENKKTLTRRKVAAFDLDDTLILSDESNWIILNEFVITRLHYLHEHGFKIVIFSNQHQLCKVHLEPQNIILKKWQEKIESVAFSLKVPIQMFFSICPDEYSKPDNNLWRLFTWEYNEGVDMDYQSSFYVGSLNEKNENRLFAAGIPIKYYTPQQEFSKDKVSVLSHFNVVQSVRIKAPADDVWSIVGEFYSLHLWHPFIRTTIKANLTGSIVRNVIFANSDGQTFEIVEKLISYDNMNREYKYKNIGKRK